MGALGGLRGIKLYEHHTFTAQSALSPGQGGPVASTARLPGLGDAASIKSQHQKQEFSTLKLSARIEKVLWKAAGKLRVLGLKI